MDLILKNIYKKMIDVTNINNYTDRIIFDSNISILNNLYVNNISEFNNNGTVISNLNIRNNLYSSSLTSKNNLTINNILNATDYYTNNLNVTGNTIINNDVSILSSLNISGNTIVSNTINLSNIYISQTSILNYATINNLNISNNSIINSLDAIQNINVSGNSTHINITLNSSLYVSNQSIFNNTIINDYINVNNNNIILGDVRTLNSLYISNLTIINNDTSFLSSLLINNDLQSYSKVNINNNLYSKINSTSLFWATTTFCSNLTVSSTTTITNNITILSSLNVYNKSTINGDMTGISLFISGNTTIMNNIIISGPTTIIGTLNVSGLTNINDINLNGYVIAELPEYDTNSSAANAGIPFGGFYRTGDILKIRTDIISPIITLSGSATMQIYRGQTFTDPGATVTDNLGEILSYTVSGTVDSNTLGTYLLNYSATDSYGNTNTITRTVYVILDIASPTITLNGNEVIKLKVGDIFIDPSVTFQDSYTLTYPFYNLSSPSLTYLYINNQNYNSLITNNWTIECWIFKPNYSSVTPSEGIIDFRVLPSTPDSSSWYKFVLGITNSGTIYGWNSTNGAAYGSSSPTVTLNQYTHLVWQRNGTFLEFYINGISAGSVNTNNAFLSFNNLNQFSLGMANDWPTTAGNYHFVGSISQVKISLGLKYTSNFTPNKDLSPSTNDLASTLFFLGDNYTDLISGKVMTYNPQPVKTYINLSSALSLTYTGLSNSNSIQYPYYNLSSPSLTYLNIKNRDFNSLINNNWTIEFWLNVASYPSITTGYNIIDFRPLPSTLSLFSGKFAFGISNTGFFYYWVGTNNSAYACSPVNSIRLNQNTHVAFVKNNNILSTFVNGQLLSSALNVSTLWTSSLISNLTEFTLGMATDWATTAANFHLSGSISQVKISIGARYTNNFIVNSDLTPLPSELSNTLFFLGDNYTDLISNQVMTYNPQPIKSYSQIFTSQYNNNVIYNLSYPSITYLNINSRDYNSLITNNWTIEGWIFITSFNTTDSTIIDFRPFSTTRIFYNGKFNFGFSSTGYFKFYYGTNDTYYTCSTSPISLNKYTHFAFIKNGNMLYTYINGVISGTLDLSLIWNSTNIYDLTEFSLGMANNQTKTATNFHLYGSLGQIKISLGVKYSSNFTPSLDLTPFTNELSNTLFYLGDSYTDIISNTIMNYINKPSKINYNNINLLNLTYYKYDYTMSTSNNIMMYNLNNPSLTYLNINNKNYNSLINNNWTVEFWVNIPNYPGTSSVVTIDFRPLSTGSGSGKCSFLIYTNGSLGFYSGNNALAYNFTSSGISVNMNTHIAFIRNRNLLLGYINGQFVGSLDITSIWTPAKIFDLTEFTLGMSTINTPTNNNDHFYGMIGQVKISLGNKYNNNFTPNFDLTPLTSELSNTLFYLGDNYTDLISNTKMTYYTIPTKTQLILQSNIPNISSSNLSSIDTSQPGKYIIEYNAIDNSGNFSNTLNRTVYIQSTSNLPAYNFSSPSNTYLYLVNDYNIITKTQFWTVECWVYLTAYSNTQCYNILDFRAVPFTSHSNKFVLNIGNTGMLGYWNGNNNSFNYCPGTINVTLNTWTHITYQRNGIYMEFYVNGTFAGQVTIDSLLDHPNMNNFNNILLGHSADQNLSTNNFHLLGSISQLKISKIKIYSTSFYPNYNLTPLSSELSNTLFFLSNNYIDTITNSTMIYPTVPQIWNREYLNNLPFTNIETRKLAFNLQVSNLPSTNSNWYDSNNSYSFIVHPNANNFNSLSKVQNNNAWKRSGNISWIMSDTSNTIFKNLNWIDGLTVEQWIYIDYDFIPSTTRMLLVGQSSMFATNDYGFGFAREYYPYNQYPYNVLTFITTVAIQTQGTGVGTINLDSLRGKWTHLAVTSSIASASSKTLKLYINGGLAITLTDSVWTSWPNPSSSTSKFTIGSNSNNGTIQSETLNKVHFGDTRVYYRILYQDEIYNNYNIDYSKYSKPTNDIYFINLPNIIENDPITNYDVTSGWLSQTLDFSILRTVSSWTIETWAYGTANDAGWILDFSIGTNYLSFGLTNDITQITPTITSDGNVRPFIYYSSDSVKQWKIKATPIAPINQWNHLVWQKNNDTTLEMYVNGISVGTFTVTASDWKYPNFMSINGLNNLIIGAAQSNPSSTTNHWKGKLSQTKITVGRKYNSSFTSQFDLSLNDNGLFLLQDNYYNNAIGKVMTINNTVTIPIPGPLTIGLTGSNPYIGLRGYAYTEAGFYYNYYTRTKQLIINIINNVDTNTIGSYNIIYSVCDNTNNLAYIKRIVNIVDDNVPPVITMVGEPYIENIFNYTYTEQGITATDNSGQPCTISITSITKNSVELLSGSINLSDSSSYIMTDTFYTYVITYSAIDPSGNSSTIKRTIAIVSPDVILYPRVIPRAYLIGSAFYGYRDMAYGNGKYIAINGIDGDWNNIKITTILYSTNKVDWISIDLNQYIPSNTTSCRFRWIIYGNGKWYISAEWTYGQTNYLTSEDGITWSVLTTTRNYYSIIKYVENAFFEIPYTNNEHSPILRSTNMINWTGVTNIRPKDTFWVNGVNGNNGTYLRWRVPIYGNGIFIAVPNETWSGYNFLTYLISYDGITWTANNINFIPSGWGGLTGMQVCFGNGLFLMSANSNMVWTSSDGINWTRKINAPLGIYNEFGTKDSNAIIFAKGKFIALYAQYNNNIVCYMTENGNTWDPVVLPKTYGTTPTDANNIVQVFIYNIFVSLNNTFILMFYAYIDRRRGSYYNGLDIAFLDNYFVIDGKYAPLLTT